MSQPVAFPGHNIVLAPPKGSESVSPLPIFRNGMCCVSLITSGGKVFVSIFSGITQPPVYVGSETTVREVTADYGVWKR